MESARASLLKCLSMLSRQLLLSSSPGAVILEIQRVMQAVTPRKLSLDLASPRQLRMSGAPLVYTTIAESPSMHCSLFGFRKALEEIPMHDHPCMHGFIRVLRGSLLITSFSRLHSPSSAASSSSTSSSSVDATPFVRFNGIREVSEHDGCIYLSPEADNIHQVRAVEDGTFFFDLLVPGYKEVDCHYFELPCPLPQIGEEIKLRRCPIPATYSCINLPYDTQLFYGNDDHIAF